MRRSSSHSVPTFVVATGGDSSDAHRPDSEQHRADRAVSASRIRLSGLLAVGLWLGMASRAFAEPQDDRSTIRRSFPACSRSGGHRSFTLAHVWCPAICLVMTKSRTAIVGVLVSGGLYWCSSRRTGKWFRQGTIAAITVSLVGMAIMSLALMTGLIDQEVISEAPKSLKYRLEYWAATSRMIVDHIWLGCGPGNFRPNYLHYKLPGASEEILDPHNLLLDVWANAGVVAWAGLLALLIWGVRTGWRAVVAEIETERSDRPLPLLRWSEGVQAALAGPALVIFQQVAFGDHADGRMWFFLIACSIRGRVGDLAVGGLEAGSPLGGVDRALAPSVRGGRDRDASDLPSLVAAAGVSGDRSPQRLLAEPIEAPESAPSSGSGTASFTGCRAGLPRSRPSSACERRSCRTRSVSPRSHEAMRHDGHFRTKRTCCPTADRSCGDRSAQSRSVGAADAAASQAGVRRTRSKSIRCAARSWRGRSAR